MKFLGVVVVIILSTLAGYLIHKEYISKRGWEMNAIVSGPAVVGTKYTFLSYHAELAGQNRAFAVLARSSDYREKMSPIPRTYYANVFWAIPTKDTLVTVYYYAGSNAFSYVSDTLHTIEINTDHKVPLVLFDGMESYILRVDKDLFCESVFDPGPSWNIRDMYNILLTEIKKEGAEEKRKKWEKFLKDIMEPSRPGAIRR
jgi:hypothetical protein